MTKQTQFGMEQKMCYAQCDLYIFEFFDVDVLLATKNTVIDLQEENNWIK